MSLNEKLTQTSDPLRSVSDEDLIIILNRAIEGGFSPLDFMNCNYYDLKQLQRLARGEKEKALAGGASRLDSLLQTLGEKIPERMRIDTQRIKSGEWKLPTGDIRSEAYELEMAELTDAVDRVGKNLDRITDIGPEVASLQKSVERMAAAFRPDEEQGIVH
ncbi:MAG: hypothetical protein AAB383_01190 [Patescibacteria group bacterium]